MNVSIIIPIYNVEKYLRKCMDSIISQTLKDIEIICVDDGSTDTCPQILDEYAQNDKRIKAIHKANEGYGKAMNTGLDLAIGTYIGIVESDDWIEPNMFEELFNYAKQYDLDFIKSDYYESWDKHNHRTYRRSQIDPIYYNKVIAKGKTTQYFYSSPQWTGIYKLSYLKKNNIRYNESPGASYQDTGFNIQNRILFNKAMIVNKAYYNYRQDNPASSVKSRGKMLMLDKEYDYIEAVLKEKSILSNNISFYNYLRFDGHKYTFNRIDDSLKREYCDYIIADYKKRKDSFDLYNCGDETLVKWINSITFDPDAFCDEIISNNKRSYERLTRSEGIIVYGTGIRAAKILSNLFDAGFSNKISCVALTNKGNENVFFDLPVFSIEDLTNQKDHLVMIAVKKDTKAFNEIKNNLDGLGFTNYMDTEGLLYLN